MQAHALDMHILLWAVLKRNIPDWLQRIDTWSRTKWNDSNILLHIYTYLIAKLIDLYV